MPSLTEWRIPMKLTDTQLALLSAAAQRQDGAIEIGPKLKGSASRKVLGKLLSEHLIEEMPAQGTLPVWRRDDKKGRSRCASPSAGSPRSAPTRTIPPRRQTKRTPLIKWRSGGFMATAGLRW
jgi:hypothetical protein